MARTSIQLPADGTGKKLDAYSYAGANGDTVHAQALTLVDSAGAVLAPATEATLAAALVSLAAILAELQGTLAVLGTVTVANPTPATETGLAKDASLAALVPPATFPLPAGQLATLTPLATVALSNPTANPETGLAKDATITGRLPDLVGDWDYYAGASGTVNVTAGQRVIGIAAHAAAAGSMTINGGASIPIPAGVGIAFQPVGNLVAPTIVFTGTDSLVVEVLT